MSTMIGFVAVMSSTMAILLLIMSSFMITLLDGMASNEEDERIRSDLSFVQGINKANSIDMTHAFSNVVGSYNLDRLKNESYLINKVEVQCSYGKNLSRDVANKYTTFNYLILIQKLNKDIVAFKTPILDTEKHNSCWLNIDKVE